jgi:hypothetical protein
MSTTLTFTTWRKSKRSGGDNSCVEVAVASDGSVIGIRDSKQQGRGPVLRLPAHHWAALQAAICAGNYDRS